MNGASLSHQSSKVPGNKRVLRGASRVVAKEPISTRLQKANFTFLKSLFLPVLLMMLALSAYEGAQRVLIYADRPISKIMIQGGLSHISQQVVQQRISPFLAASFFTVDLSGIRQNLEKMPWISHVKIRRTWPAQVRILIEEQLPIARWGDESLLNNQGQAFTPRDLDNYEHLPQLFGPHRAQQQVMKQYQVLSQMLRPMGFPIVQLELRDRGSWFLTTGVSRSGPGIELLLGRDHLVEKMIRFVSIYDKILKEQITNIASVDLRYSNSLAVRWRASDDPIAAQPTVA